MIHVMIKERIEGNLTEANINLRKQSDTTTHCTMQRPNLIARAAIARLYYNEDHVSIFFGALGSQAVHSVVFYSDPNVVDKVSGEVIDYFDRLPKWN